MKFCKTYGMAGLLEWHGVIGSGSVKLNVSFTNGSVTAYGVAPATFITKNELHQFVVENSKEFKSGRIFLVRSSVIPGTEHEEEHSNQPAASATEEPQVGTETEATVSETEVANTEPDNDFTFIEVADKSEAVEYLKEHFSEEYTGVKLRSKAAFEEACRVNNVKFIFSE